MSRRLWIAVAAIALLGLALRVAAAQGALWLDEAWSAVMAHEARTPLGVLLNINHDNNHHLNTLWLQLMGLDAPPVLQRGLSILSGTAAVVVAALIGARRGTAPAVCAALLFAVSPLLVTYGAEARGYAPMLLAMLVAVLLVAQWLEDPERRVPAVALFATGLLGMLAQLTMAFGLAAILLWAAVALLASRPRREAFADLRRLLVPLAMPAILVPILVLGAAGSSETGLQIGSYEPFAWGAAFTGLAQLGGALFGAPWLFLLVLLLAAAGAYRDIRWRGGRSPEMFALLALLIPVGVLLLQLGNSGMPRYYLVPGATLLLLAALWAGQAIAAGMPRAVLGAAAMATAIIASLIGDAAIIADRRADPAHAIAAMRGLAPAGSDAASDQPRAIAVLRAAAAIEHYPLTIAEGPCPATRFLFVDRDGDQPFPAAPERCGARYRHIAEAHPAGLSGTHWKLYERVPAGPR